MLRFRCLINGYLKTKSYCINLNKKIKKNSTKMLIGYARVSKADGSQVLDLQKDALLKAGIESNNIYCDYASGKLDDRPNLISCLKALRKGEDTLVVWKLDRLGRNLKHLIEIIDDLQTLEIGFKVITGQGANIDTSTANG